MARRSTTKAGKGYTRLGRNKIVKNNKQEKAILEVGNGIKRDTPAKESRKEGIDIIDFKAMLEDFGKDIVKDVFREIRKRVEAGNKKIKDMQERVDKLEKGFCKIQKVGKRDTGVGRMKRGSKRRGSGGENKLGKNNVRCEHNGVGRGRSYRSFVIGMEDMSKTREVFSEKEVCAIKWVVLEQERNERKDKIAIKGVKIEGRVEKE